MYIYYKIVLSKLVYIKGIVFLIVYFKWYVDFFKWYVRMIEFCMVI